MRPFEECVHIIQGLRKADTRLKQQMIEVRDRYNGDVVMPLLDVEGEPTLQSPSPQLIADAIDASAMRAASTWPTIDVPAVDPAKLQGKGSVEFAGIRRRSIYSVWHESALRLTLRRSYRQLAGYGSFAMMVVPDYDLERPRIVTRDALTTYPEPRAPEDIRRPGFVGFVFRRSADWLVGHYPQLRDVIGSPESMWDVLEWIDKESIQVGLIGRVDAETQSDQYSPMRDLGPTRLHSGVNRAGIVPVAVGHQITLDRVASSIARVVGSADLMDRLLALDILAQEKAIFTDRYLVAQEGRAPRIVNGRWMDGRTGEMNILEGVASVGEMRGDTSPRTDALIDRVERNIRVSSGNPSLFGGELTGSLRSGQTVNALGSFSIDPRVQELQEVAGYHLSTLNEAVLATFEGCFPNRKLTLFSGWPSDKGLVELDTGKHIESHKNVVSYAFPGADVNSATVAVGQLVGSRLMSRQTGRNMHPMVDDASFEDQAIMEEALTDAILQGSLAQVTDGSLPLIDAAAVLKYLREGKAIDTALIQASEDAQRRQAAEAPPPEEGMAVPPETQPGLAMPGQGVEQADPSTPFPAPAEGADNLRQLMNSLVGPVTRARSVAA